MGEIRQNLSIGNYGKWYQITAFFDTGANISYIRESIANRISAPKFKKVQTKLADGSIVNGYFSQINVKIYNRVGLLDVIIVPKLDEELIIGQDFMQKNSVQLDLKEEKIRFTKLQPRLRKVYRL